MKLEASIQKAVGVPVQGMFGLRTLLQDHASESCIHAITLKASAMYDDYRAEKSVGHFAPDFMLVKQKGAKLHIEIRAKGSEQSIGVIPLKAKEHQGYQQLELDISDKKTQRRKAINRVANALRLSQLMQELVPVIERLSVTCNDELARFLSTKPSFEWSFDLDCDEEKVTVVAYWENTRTAVLTLFF